MDWKLTVSEKPIDGSIVFIQDDRLISDVNEFGSGIAVYVDQHYGWSNIFATAKEGQVVKKYIFEEPDKWKYRPELMNIPILTELNSLSEILKNFEEYSFDSWNDKNEDVSMPKNKLIIVVDPSYTYEENSNGFKYLICRSDTREKTCAFLYNLNFEFEKVINSFDDLPYKWFEYKA